MISTRQGIPIRAEEELETIVRSADIDEVWFSYSDVPHSYVMDKASRVIGWGAHFGVCSAQRTMLPSTKPVIAVTAVRTGVGKSQTSRYISRILRQMGLRVVAVRHPMPYGDLPTDLSEILRPMRIWIPTTARSRSAKSTSPTSTTASWCTQGIDYERILRQAEQGSRSHSLGWRQQRHPVLCTRSSHHAAGSPSTGSRVDLLPGSDQFPHLGSAHRQQGGDRHARGIAETVLDNCRKFNPEAQVVQCRSGYHGRPTRADRWQAGAGGRRRTHAHPWRHDLWRRLVCRQEGRSRRDRRSHPYAVGSIKETYEAYPNSREDPSRRWATDRSRSASSKPPSRPTDADVVVEGTPINLQRILTVNKPIANVRLRVGGARALELSRRAVQAVVDSRR